MSYGNHGTPANQPSSTTSNQNLSKNIKNQHKKPKLNKKIKSQNKRRTDKKQNKLINKLSDQVYQLQMAKYGKVQLNFQTMQEPLIPTSDYPITFNLNDISCKRTTAGGTPTFSGCRFYQADSSGHVQAISNVFKINVSNNIYWERLNKDGPDTGGYYLDSVRYFFNIKGRPNLDDTRVRIDIIAQKPGTLSAETVPNGPAGALVPTILPYTLPYMSNLVGGVKNRINGLHFKKYLTKTFYLNSQPAQTSAVHPTTSNSQNWSFTIRPNKPILQKSTYPIYTPGVTGATLIDSPYGPDNISSHLTPLHCIISTDDITASAGDQVNVTISRRCVFRDMMGSALLNVGND